jgi:hypothetical protein
MGSRRGRAGRCSSSWTGRQRPSKNLAAPPPCRDTGAGQHRGKPRAAPGPPSTRHGSQRLQPGPGAARPRPRSGERCGAPSPPAQPPAPTCGGVRALEDLERAEADEGGRDTADDSGALPDGVACGARRGPPAAPSHVSSAAARRRVPGRQRGRWLLAAGAVPAARAAPRPAGAARPRPGWAVRLVPSARQPPGHPPPPPPPPPHPQPHHQPHPHHHPALAHPCSARPGSPACPTSPRCLPWWWGCPGRGWPRSTGTRGWRSAAPGTGSGGGGGGGGEAGYAAGAGQARGGRRGAGQRRQRGSAPRHGWRRCGRGLQGCMGGEHGPCGLVHRGLVRHTLRPSAWRLKGVSPAPLSCSSQRSPRWLTTCRGRRRRGAGAGPGVKSWLTGAGRLTSRCRHAPAKQGPWAATRAAACPSAAASSRRLASAHLAQVDGGAIAQLPAEVAKLEAAVAVGERLRARQRLAARQVLCKLWALRLQAVDTTGCSAGCRRARQGRGRQGPGGCGEQQLANPHLSGLEVEQAERGPGHCHRRGPVQRRRIDSHEVGPADGPRGVGGVRIDAQALGHPILEVQRL